MAQQLTVVPISPDNLVKLLHCVQPITYILGIARHLIDKTHSTEQMGMHAGNQSGA